MADDMDDDFMEYGAGIRGGMVECPACGAKVPYGVLVDDEGVCPKCGNKIDIDEDDAIDDDDDFGEDDEDEGLEAGETPRCEEHRGQGKGEGEEGVLYKDQLAVRPQLSKNHTPSICGLRDP